MVLLTYALQYASHLRLTCWGKKVPTFLFKNTSLPSNMTLFPSFTAEMIGAIAAVPLQEIILKNQPAIKAWDVLVYEKLLENILYLHRQAKLLCFKHQKVPFLWMELQVNNVHFISSSWQCFKLLERVKNKLTACQINPQVSLNQLNSLEPADEEDTENVSKDPANE